MKELERWERFQYLKKCLIEGAVVLVFGILGMGAVWLSLIGLDKLMNYLGI